MNDGDETGDYCCELLSSEHLSPDGMDGLLKGKVEPGGTHPCVAYQTDLFRPLYSYYTLIVVNGKMPAESQEPYATPFLHCKHFIHTLGQPYNISQIYYSASYLFRLS